MKTKLLTTSSAAIMAALLNACAPVQDQPKPSVSSGKDVIADEPALEQAIIRRVNDIRSRSNLSTLARDQDLDRLARMHSRYMKSNQAKLELGGADTSYAGREGRQYAAYRLYCCDYSDENVASFTVSGSPQQTAEAVVKLWEDLPNNKEPMTLPMLNRTGISVTKGSDGYYFVTQIFARKSPYPHEPMKRIGGHW